ncbi:PQQ-dependent sugar dehydrogenase [Salinimicrobium oceani]|uniref:PQQ-dependent sugar dehydrogenase n=1 Tax=Salinimicrobium oceani TaxID=2722702 RepID=A0ABX1CXI2_9FLAO|nr:PQQ-dependent sugar dehydrogenase [Salinimicrobium oceani]NJW51376.1 PQQ-dependent sugar dehydrogenase [Salinimicrobium oceani]
MKRNQHPQVISLPVPGLQRFWISFFLIVLLSAAALAQKPTVKTDAGDVKIHKIAENLDHPWGMAFLPDSRLLVTERAGALRILEKDSTLSVPLSGTPKVFAEGQGGLLDVALHPNFEENNYVYLTFSEPGENNTATTALGRGKLLGNSIEGFEVLFRMEPKVEGPNHFGGRIIFTPENDIFLTLAERFKFEPAQDLSSHLGTIVRLKEDGTPSEANPSFEESGAREEIWSYGHRNIESAALHPETGTLWVAEMGPMGGDELQPVEAGKNYGWPVVSWGDNYDGSKIPRPTTRPEFADALIKWTPTISPSGMIFYNGDLFPEWKNSMMIGGLTSTGIVRVQVDDGNAKEVERIPLSVRVRDVEQGPDGSIWVLTDEDNGKILQLKPLK